MTGHIITFRLYVFNWILFAIEPFFMSNFEYFDLMLLSVFKSLVTNTTDFTSLHCDGQFLGN